MKKLSLLLIAIITLSACAKQEVEKVEKPVTQDTNTTTIAETTTIQITEEVSATTQAKPQATPPQPTDMPELFEHVGGDDNARFFQHCVSEMFGNSHYTDKFAEYLGSREFFERWNKEWDSREGDFSYKVSGYTSLMDYPNMFEFIVSNDIPDDVIISAIHEHNEFIKKMHQEHHEKIGTPGFFGKEYPYRPFFTDEEIEILLTRDEAKVLAHFALEQTIVIGDRAYAPVWLYYHTPDDYRKAGITPEMLEKKLDSYAEFVLTDEADRAFSAKLTEFMGEEVSLKERRESRE